MKLTTLRPSRFFPSSKKESKKGASAGKIGSFGSAASSEESAVSALPRAAAPAAVVTQRELEAVLRRLVTGEDELAAMLAELQRGAAELEEVGAAEEGELREAFAVFDADGDGRISAEELRALFAALGDEQCSVDDCRHMIGGVDTDGDGFVCFEEFARMMHGF